MNENLSQVEQSPELSTEERIRSLESQVENLTSLVRTLLNDREQLKKTHVLPPMPDDIISE